VAPRRPDTIEMQFISAEIDTATLFNQVAFNHLPGLCREFVDAVMARLSLQSRPSLTNHSFFANGL
jgi:hypothetical protein